MSLGLSFNSPASANISAFSAWTEFPGFFHAEVTQVTPSSENKRCGSWDSN